MRPYTTLIVLSLMALAGCNNSLECEDGRLTKGGDPFTSCEQCEEPSTCRFTKNQTVSYDITGHIAFGSGTVTASCDEETASYSYQLDSTGSVINRKCQ